MYNLIARFMNNLTKEQVNNFALEKGANLSEQELEFTYNFLKKNWDQIFKSPTLLNLERYKNEFSPENFVKLKQIVQEYSSKYQNFLK